MIVPSPPSNGNTAFSLPSRAPLPTKDRWVAWASIIYLVLSLASGVWFLNLLDPSLSNNLFWPFYNTSGYERFLIDVVNVKLWTAQSGVVDLMDVVQFNRSYGHASGTHLTSTLEYQPTYARRVLLTELNTLRRGIQDVRRASPVDLAAIAAQYCWVDLHRRWVVAVTKRRMQRCADSYMDNAAAYLETMARNTDWLAFVGVFGLEWHVAVAAAVEGLPGGAAWLAERSAAANLLSLDDEVRFLESHNLTRFDLSWQNRADVKLEEIVQVENALGLRETLTVKVVSRTTELPWTTSILQGNLENTLMLMLVYNASLVRDTPRHFRDIMGRWDYIFGLDGADGEYFEQRLAFMTTIGPFGSVDAFFVAVPRLLQVVHAAYATALQTTFLADPDFQDTLQRLPRSVFTPLPPNFKFGRVDYYGGNLLCTSGMYTPYPQSQLAIDDTCAAVAPFELAASSQGMLFAWLYSGASSADDVCALQGSDCCVGVLGAVLAVATSTGPQLTPNKTLVDLATTVDFPPVLFVQYAHDVDLNSWEVLQQPLIVPSDPTWSFFGWLALFDWIEGRREVVRMDGDVSTLVLMTEEYAPSTHQTSNNRPVVQRGTRILFQACVYFTVVLVAVAMLTLMAAATSRQLPRNLFVFNRVVASAWLSRFVVGLRGVAAIVVLSTSQIDLVLDHGNSRFHFHQRSWLATAVIAGETTWVSYALHEVLSVLNLDAARAVGQVAAPLAFLTTLVLETVAPIPLKATLQRTCFVDSIEKFVHCHSGIISVGQFSRVILLAAVHGVCYVVASIAVRWLPLASPRTNSAIARHTAPSVLHGTAATHLNMTKQATYDSVWHLDDATCTMCGLIPLTVGGRSYMLDIKLWTLLQNDFTPAGQTRETAFRCASTTTSIPPILTLPPVQCDHVGRRWHVISACLGLTYTFMSAVGNVSYLAVSNVNLANDFCWATFNLTAHHAVLGQWFHEQLALGKRIDVTKMDEPRWTSLGVNVSGSNTALLASPYPHVSALHSLATTIAGLRTTDPRLAPWIFTPYCWLDFNRTWEMANTARRQERCSAWRTNGAKYFESVLRNIPWDLWMAAWGEAFAIAIGNDLAGSVAGRTWLAKTAQPTSSFRTSVADEILHWQQLGIDHFAVQWQNFKTTGVVSTYSVENAFGMQYRRTITHTNGSFRLPAQTTYKMYWGLANDLTVVSDNTTGASGRSLLRSSPRFAFANVSLADVMAEVGTLIYPYYESFGLIETTIGPFGAIDVRLQRCPPSLQDVVATGLALVRSIVATNATAGELYDTLAPTERTAFWALPKTFLDKAWLTYGGNLLCGNAPVPSMLRNSLLTLTSASEMCGLGYQSYLTSAKSVVLVAVMASGLGHDNDSRAVAAACDHLATITLEGCLGGSFGSAIQFMQRFQPTSNKAMDTLATTARTELAALDIRLMQFTRLSDGDPLEILSSPFFAPNDPSFDVWSWMYVVEWALGEREVVVVDGDVGSISLVTEWTSPVVQVAASEELPTNFARYALRGVQYVTVVLVTVSSMAVAYILTSRGQVEGLNMFELNRVAGLVWVGRPLLLLRGVTALMLLSTATLELTATPSAVQFASPKLAWYKAILGAGEATWLVYILNDVCMVAMDKYAPNYAGSSSLVVWGAAAALTLLQPVQHAVTVTLDCEIDQVDFQVVCDTGIVRIGSFDRLCTLLGLIGAANVLSYVLVRVLGKSTSSASCPSMLLSSPAKCLYQWSRWRHQGVYFIDPASALLTGIVSIRYGGAIYAMDIKLWRGFVFRVDDSHKSTLPRHLAFAIPLTE